MSTFTAINRSSLLVRALSGLRHAGCHGACGVCMARTLVRGIRAFSTTKMVTPRTDKGYDLNKLTKFIDQEIDFNRRLIKDEQLSPDRVLEEYAKLVRENNISVEINQDDVGEVIMTIPKENGLKYVLKFNASQVADSINAARLDTELEDNEQEDGRTEMSAEDADEMLDEGEFDEEKMPFNISLEIHRDNQPKYATIEAEVSPSIERRGEYDLFISDMYLQRKADQMIEAGPSFDTLDDDLREQLDQLVNKSVRKMIPLVADYAKAKDAHQYGSWLHDLKEITGGSQA